MEIADRLNAVGRDISILIQPMDLVRQVRSIGKLYCHGHSEPV